MSLERRIFSPVVASVLSGAIVAAATLGGTLAGDRAAVKSDRFAVVGDQLCEGQVWPNLSEACLAWSQGETPEQTERFLTLSDTDVEAGQTTLTRVRQIPTH